MTNIPGKKYIEEVTQGINTTTLSETRCGFLEMKLQEYTIRNLLRNNISSFAKEEIMESRRQLGEYMIKVKRGQIKVLSMKQYERQQKEAEKFAPKTRFTSKTFYGIIFNLNDVLVETDRDYKTRVLEKTFNELERLITPNCIKEFLYGDRGFILDLLNLEWNQFWHTFDKYDTAEERANNTKPYNDAGEIIPRIKKRDCFMGVVTGAPEHIAQAQLELLGSDNFSKLISNHGTGEELKTKGVEKLIYISKLKHNEVVYITNSERELVEARNLGIPTRFINRNKTYETLECVKELMRL